MAGTLVITYSESRTVKKVLFDWLSDVSGDVNGTLTKKLSGQILRFVFMPDTGGTKPTTAYDVTCEDEDGIDVLAGDGANLANDANTQIIPVFTNGIAFDGTLELKVANAGNAKGGKVILYMR